MQQFDKYIYIATHVVDISIFIFLNICLSEW